MASSRDNLILVIKGDNRNLVKALGDSRNRLDKFFRAVSALNKGLAENTQETNKNSNAQSQRSKASRQAVKVQEELVHALQRSSRSFRQNSREMTTGVQKLDMLAARLDRASMYMWKFTIAAMPIRSLQFQFGIVTAAIIGVERAATNAYREVARMRNTFVGMGDTAAEAARKTDFLVDMARKLPFTFDQVTKAAMAFYTSGVAQSIPEMKKWLLAAADMGAAATAQGHDIARAAEALVDSVTGEHRRLRQTYHVTAETIRQYSRDAIDGNGKIVNSERHKAGLLRMVNEKWGGTAAQQMADLDGSITNFNDALFRLGVTVGELLSGPLGWLTKAGASLLDVINNLTRALGPFAGSLLVAAPALSILGLGITSIAAMALQITGMRGSLLMLTKDTGKLFEAIVAVNKASEARAIMMSNDMMQMSNITGAVNREALARMTLADAIKAEEAAYAELMAIEGGEVTTERRAAVAAKALEMKAAKDVLMRRQWVAMPTAPGMTPLSEGERLARLAQTTGVEVGVLEQYLQRLGKSAQDVTAVEMVAITAEAERAGLMGKLSVATAAANDQLQAQAAAEAELATATAEATVAEIVHARNRERWEIGNIVTGFRNRLGGFSFSSIFSGLSGSFHKLSVAMHTATGGLITMGVAAIAVGASISRIAHTISEQQEYAEKAANEAKQSLEGARQSGLMTEVEYQLRQKRIEQLTEEDKGAINKRMWASGLFTALTLFGGGIPMYLLGQRVTKGMEGEEMDIEAKMAELGNAPSLLWRLEKAPGDTVRWHGHSVPKDEAREAIYGLWPGAENIQQNAPLRTSLDIASAEYEKQRLAMKQGGTDYDAMREAALAYADALEDVADAEYAIGVLTKNGEAIKEASAKRLQAVTLRNKTLSKYYQRQIGEQQALIQLYKAQEVDSQTISALLEEESNQHYALAQVYDEQGRHADALRERLTSLRRAQESLLYPLQEEIAQRDRAISELREHTWNAQELAKALEAQARARAQLSGMEISAERRGQEAQKARRLHYEAGLAPLTEAAERAQLSTRWARLYGARGAALGGRILAEAGAQSRLARYYAAHGRNREAAQAAYSAAELQKSAAVETQSYELEKASRAAKVAREEAGSKWLLNQRAYELAMRELEAQRELARVKRDMLGMQRAEDGMLKLQRQRVDAIRDEKQARAEAYYTLMQAAAKEHLVGKERVESAREYLQSVLQERIKNEDDLTEKIRLQTQLIELQAKKAGSAYDDILRRIIGGPAAVDEAISMQQLARRFGPNAIPGANNMQVLERNQNTLYLELGNNAQRVLREAIGNAAPEAFLNTIIEGVVNRLRG